MADDRRRVLFALIDEAVGEYFESVLEGYNLSVLPSRLDIGNRMEWHRVRDSVADRIEALYAEAIKCERAIAKAAAASPQRKS